MLYKSIFMDMNVYALQLKQKSTASVSNQNLKNFRTATFKNNFKWLFLKGIQMRHSDPCDFKFSFFPRQLFIKS